MRREDPSADPGVERNGHIASDEVQQPTAAVRTNRAAKHRGDRLEVTQADVLEHPDRDERIVLPVTLR
jgi:hypothetical protein